MNLIVTEKNIAARRIAAILAPKNPKKDRVSGVDVYRYEIRSGENEQETVVVGLSGHIVGIDFPKEIYNILTLDEKEGVTTLTLTGWPVNATENEEKTYYSFLDNMQNGFNGTLNQLEKYLQKGQ